MPATPGTDPAPCQVYAIIEAGPGARDRLAALLTSAPLTSVLIAPAAGHPLTAALAQPLVALAQKRDCAALIADDAALARTLRADGVHLAPGDDLLDRYREARSILGGGAIVGVDAGGSRHLAMEAGEAGADYIGFSAAPSAPLMADTGIDPEPDIDLGLHTRDDLIRWWAEVFEVPCVAFTLHAPDEARAAAAAGADFVALRFAGGEAIAAATERLSAIASLLELVDAP